MTLNDNDELKKVIVEIQMERDRLLLKVKELERCLEKEQSELSKVRAFQYVALKESQKARQVLLEEELKMDTES